MASIGRSERFETIVAGAGVMGAAAAWHAAKAGRRVLLLERFRVGHERGSSHGDSRITRLTYHAGTYVRLAREAFALWEELERDANEALFTRTGDVFFGAGGGAIEGYERVLEAEGVPFERLDAEALAGRFPQFRLDPGQRALFQAAGGMLAAGRCVQALVRAARGFGAEIREEEPLRAIDRAKDPIEVETDRGRYACDRLVIAAGAWMPRIVPELALPLRVLRQDVCYFAPPRGAADDFRPDRFPVWVKLGGGAAADPGAPDDRRSAGWGDDISYYGFPIFGRFGLKLAAFVAGGEGADPDTLDRAIRDPEAVAAGPRAFLARHIPAAAEGALVHAETCLFTMAPDEDFVIDLHPEDARIAIGSPCSGHGFKFGVAIGKALAELAHGGRTTVRAIEADRARFAIGRFAGRP